jgi:hypothetical protein
MFAFLSNTDAQAAAFAERILAAVRAAGADDDAADRHAAHFGLASAKDHAAMPDDGPAAGDVAIIAAAVARAFEGVGARQVIPVPRSVLARVVPALIAYAGSQPGGPGRSAGAADATDQEAGVLIGLAARAEQMSDEPAEPLSMTSALVTEVQMIADEAAENIEAGSAANHRLAEASETVAATISTVRTMSDALLSALNDVGGRMR